MLKCNSNAT